MALALRGPARAPLPLIRAIPAQLALPRPRMASSPLADAAHALGLRLVDDVKDAVHDWVLAARREGAAAPVETEGGDGKPPVKRTRRAAAQSGAAARLGNEATAPPPRILVVASPLRTVALLERMGAWLHREVRTPCRAQTRGVGGRPCAAHARLRGSRRTCTSSFQWRAARRPPCVCPAPSARWRHGARPRTAAAARRSSALRLCCALSLLVPGAAMRRLGR